MSASRYIRQEKIASFGRKGQEKLGQSRVLVVGAGGLGCPVLLYLAGAGVGTIGIADGDVVDMTNLHRQVLFTEDSIGLNKATEAARLLNKRNSSIRYLVSEHYLTVSDLSFFTLGWDVVIDATDRMETRYLLDDLCRIQNVPLVHASVSGDEIQVAVFDTTTGDPKDRVCYRHLYPNPPESRHVRTCTEEGILGSVPGIAGLIQARACLDLLTGAGGELKGQVLWMDTARHRQRVFRIPSRKSNQMEWPETLQEVSFTDYTALCQGDSIKSTVTDDWLTALQSGALLIDVREIHEQPRFLEFSCRQIPLGRFGEFYQDFEPHDTIIVFCQTGTRGKMACENLLSRWPEKRIFNVPGGIQALNEHFKIQNSPTA